MPTVAGAGQLAGRARQPGAAEVLDADTIRSRNSSRQHSISTFSVERVTHLHRRQLLAPRSGFAPENVSLASTGTRMVNALCVVPMRVEDLPPGARCRGTGNKVDPVRRAGPGWTASAAFAVLASDTFSGDENRCGAQRSCLRCRVG